jgi:DNA-3-methyladenine glycosylase II|tara:strand:+ start:37 stop:648 length:612 start_codon:yes stop_codon:yes gene_type:complete
MESDQAYKTLLILTKKYKFDELHRHIRNIGPLKIKLSKLKFDHHLCKIIVGQQISTKAADAIWARVAKILEGKLPKNPTQNLQKRLKGAGLSARKVDYMIGIIYNEEITSSNRRKLKTKSAEDFSNLLLSIKGIGKWTVDMSRIFYLGDSDVMPLTDLGIIYAHKIAFPKEKIEEKFYKQFSPYNSYLSLFMWRLLEDENLSI